LLPSITTVKNELSLDLRDKGQMVERYARSAARLGYETITLYVKDEEDTKKIQKTLEKDLIGYEIISQDKFKTVIKNMSMMKSEQFFPYLERNRDVTLSMIKGISDIIKSKNIEEMQSVLYLETTNNKIISFCKNILLNETSFSRKESIIWYSILEYFEKICDILRYLGIYIKDNFTEVGEYTQGMEFSFGKLYDLTGDFIDYLLDKSTKFIDNYDKNRFINYEIMKHTDKLSNVDTAIFHYIMTTMNLVGFAFYQATKLQILKHENDELKPVL